MWTLALGLTGCDGQPGREFRGHLVELGNDMGFIQCGSTDTLLITFEHADTAQATMWIERGTEGQDTTRAVPSQPPELPYVVLLAERAEANSDQTKRNRLLTFRILSIRDSTPAECR